MWKECSLNRWNRNYQRYIHGHFIITYKQIHRNENILVFLTKIYNEKCWNLFSIRKSWGILRTIFQLYHLGTFRVLQCKIPETFYFQLYVASAAFQRNNLRFFFKKLKEHRLRVYIFTSTEYDSTNFFLRKLIVKAYH